jgi:UDP-N-acetylglucosamine 2-epimerase (non-hydrolysing)
MKLVIVYGTRPEFLKLKMLIDQLKKNKSLELIVVKIAQHTLDDEGYPDVILSIDEHCSDRISNIGSNILQKLPEIIKDSTHLLSQGDTATVFYSMLCAFQMKKKCIHLEAGMRTYDLENPFPEEGYRQMVSRITDIHLCPSDVEKQFLISERVRGEIHVIGNTILDLVKSYSIPISHEKKVLVTLHRRENWDGFKNSVIELTRLALKQTDYQFFFLSHPNPSLQKILSEIKDIPVNFNISKSLNHNDLISLLSSCSIVITDSGGIQEEANFLGKYIYVLRKVTERSSISSSNMKCIDTEDIINIECFIRCFPGYEYGDGNSIEKIYNILTCF